jgi:outer membrane protein assembly factor BamD
VYSLDQTDTVKALEKLQAFIDNYPNSEYVAQANEVVKVLNGKLEKKAYENAKDTIQFQTINQL